MSFTTVPVVFHRRTKWILILFPLMILAITFHVFRQTKLFDTTTGTYSAIFLVLHCCVGFCCGNIIFDFILAIKDYVNLKDLYNKSMFKCLEYVYSLDVIIVSVLTCFLFFHDQIYHLLPFLSSVLLSLLRNLTFNYSSPELHELVEKHQLNIGYGAAMCYYHNYLKHFVPKVFLERIRTFSGEQKVSVNEQLIILIPQSCITRRNLGENERIERARELPPYHMDIAGIKKRVYNITVYQVLKSCDDDDNDSIWQAVEYAQPLHDFYDLKRKQKITENEMHQERQIFMQTLQELLCDEERSNETVILLPYDDTNGNLKEADLILNKVSN